MTLPEPNFITRDITAITQEMIAKYESDTGKTLQPAQMERILIDLLAYRENLIRIGIQEAAKQNLVNYATYPVLDYLGELVGVERLDPVKAETIIRASLTATKTFAVDIPTGTKIESKDGAVIFVTKYAGVIPVGQLYVDIEAEAEAAGAASNNYLAGEINNPISTVAYVNTFANTTTTAGGADEELDIAFRERIKQAPEAFTTAGSKGAYEALVKSAHQDIIDVAIIKYQPDAQIDYTIGVDNYSVTADEDGFFTGTGITSGSVDYRIGEADFVFSSAVDALTLTIPPVGTVKIYPLTVDGNPSQIITDKIIEIFEDDSKKPLNDEVIVESPTQVDYTINVNLTTYTTYIADDVKTNVENALADYTEERKKLLGLDIVPAQILSIIFSVPGVYDATVNSPALIAIAENEWANCTGITVTLAGEANG